MRRLLYLGVVVYGLVLAGCSGGASGDPDDDIGDIFILTHSPGNGDELSTADSNDGFNALNNPTLRNPGAVTLIFTNSLDVTSVRNTDPSDPQGTRNVRLFFFDTAQGPFDPSQPTVPGVNPPGANVLVNATTVIPPEGTFRPNDTLIIRPAGVSPTAPLPEGQYSVIVELGVRGADGDGMKGQEYFFSFRVGQDNLGPVVVSSAPAPGQTNVDPRTDVRVTLSETILASTVSTASITVTFQPAGVATPIPIPGLWFTDGGNGPGNNFPALQLDQNGNAGQSGTSPRNGADVVFRPDLTAFPVNMAASDPICLTIDPPQKGNSGFPRGQAITVAFQLANGVTDTAGNVVPLGSPNTTFTFQTEPLPNPVFAPNTNSAVYFGDTIGVGVIDVNPARTPYLVGPNPARQPNSVVTSGNGAAQEIVRVAIPDLVDISTDSRPYTSFYSFADCPGVNPGRLFMGNLYAASSSTGGGEVVIVDTYEMNVLGRFGTPSPGGIGITALGGTGRMTVSNFSANTVTLFDIASVRWYTQANNTLWATSAGLAGDVAAGGSQLILTEEDFRRVFPAQRSGVISPPGPAILGTINVGISPSKVKITALPNSMGIPAFGGPAFPSNSIICALNAGESTADFSEIINLTQSAAVEPDLRGVNLSSQPTDVAFAPWNFSTGSIHFYISSVGGTVELFSTGFVSNQPSVRAGSSTNAAPNQIINNIGGLSQPTAVQYITNGNAQASNNGYSEAVLVAETGENRVQALSIIALAPSNLFQAVNENLSSGLGPVDLTGEPASIAFAQPIAPRFTTYFVANAGEGTVRTSSYLGGVIGTDIPVPGVLLVASWWSR